MSPPTAATSIRRNTSVEDRAKIQKIHQLLSDLAVAAARARHRQSVVANVTSPYRCRIHHDEPVNRRGGGCRHCNPQPARTRSENTP